MGRGIQNILKVPWLNAEIGWHWNFAMGDPLGTPCEDRCSRSPQGHTARGHRQSMSLPLT